MDEHLSSYFQANRTVILVNLAVFYNFRNFFRYFSGMFRALDTMRIPGSPWAGMWGTFPRCRKFINKRTTLKRLVGGSQQYWWRGFGLQPTRLARANLLFEGGSITLCCTKQPATTKQASCYCVGLLIRASCCNKSCFNQIPLIDQSSSLGEL